MRAPYADDNFSRFASNQRSENDLLKVKTHLQGILETLRNYTAASSTLLIASVLRKIIAFNRPRLQSYIKHLSSQTQRCLGTPRISSELSDRLSELKELAIKADNRELEEGQCK